MEYRDIQKDVAAKVKAANKLSEKELKKREEIGKQRAANPIYIKEGVRGKDLKRMKKQQKQAEISRSTTTKRKTIQKKYCPFNQLQIDSLYKKSRNLLNGDKFLFDGIEYLAVYCGFRVFIFKQAGRGNRKEMKIKLENSELKFYN